jgi:hypothetical protein
MKVAVFGTALLVFAIPAFGQIETAGEPVVVGGACQAALFSPGVPSAIIILPTPVQPAVPGFRSPQPRGAHSGFVQPGIVMGPVVGGGVMVPGMGAVSSVGSIPSSGIGTMSSLGIGHMTSSGVGMMTSSGIGAIGMPVVPSVPAPGVAPSSVRGNVIARPHSLQPSVLVCP